MNGLLIGRFQPFHLGHLYALKFCLSKVEKLWIGLGSSNKPSEKQNPFSADERKEMILCSIDKEISKQIQIYYIPDVGNHEKWIQNIDALTPDYDIVFSNDELTQHIYSTHGKEVISVELQDRNVLSGTSIRSMIFNDQNWQEYVPEGTKKILLKINARKRLKSFNYK